MREKVRHELRSDAHDLHQRKRREHEDGDREHERAFAEGEREQRRGHQQDARAEEFVAEPEPGELAARAEPGPIDAQIDQRGHDEQQQQLDEVDPEREARDRQEQGEPQPGGEIAGEIREAMHEVGCHRARLERPRLQRQARDPACAAM